MTRDDIIGWMQEVGAKKSDLTPQTYDGFVDLFERFAALVAAAECEKVARWMIRNGYATGHGDTIEDLLTELEWQVAEREREACAKICEEATLKNWFAEDCVDLIRERGEV